MKRSLLAALAVMLFGPLSAVMAVDSTKGVICDVNEKAHTFVIECDDHDGGKPGKDKPKQDSPKQDSPKQDSPKQDSPKQDSPKQDSPKQDSPKQEGHGHKMAFLCDKGTSFRHGKESCDFSALKVGQMVEVSYGPISLVGGGKDKPDQDGPKQDSPKQDSPKQDSPKQDSPKQDSPKQDSPKQDKPKQEQEGDAPIKAIGKKGDKGDKFGGPKLQHRAIEVVIIGGGEGGGEQSQKPKQKPENPGQKIEQKPDQKVPEKADIK